MATGCVIRSGRFGQALDAEAMRYLAALLIAASLIFLVFWGGAKIVKLVEPAHRDYNEYTVGRKMNLCGYQVDYRHIGGGYDLHHWRGGRCESLSKLDRCMLKCLSDAGTVKIGAACFNGCVRE
jgi:hypothetical protein